MIREKSATAGLGFGLAWRAILAPGVGGVASRAKCRTTILLAAAINNQPSAWLVRRTEEKSNFGTITNAVGTPPTAARNAPPGVASRKASRDGELNPLMTATIGALKITTPPAAAETVVRPSQPHDEHS